MAKVLSDQYKKMLLSMKPEDYSVSFVTKYFSYTGKRDGSIVPPKIGVKDKIHLDAGEYINKVAIDTTAGKFLFNKLVIEGKIDHLIDNGYYNQNLTKKRYGKISQMLADSLLAGTLSVETLTIFLRDFEFYGLKMCPIFSPSFTEGVLKPKSEVREARDKAFKDKPKEEFTPNEVIQLEDKLVRLAAKANSNDPGMTLYDSGSRGAFDNDYKNISVMIGAVQNAETGKNEIITSNYMDGFQKEDICGMANNVVAASYPRAVLTAVGGYLTKQFYSVFQSIQLDDKGTDCQSQFTLDTVLTESNFQDFEFQFVMDKGKPVELSSKTKEKYIGKRVRIRTPMGCTGTKICNVCAGNRFYYTEITNVGLTAGKVSNELMQKQMKKFHNMKLHLKEADPAKLLLE